MGRIGVLLFIEHQTLVSEGLIVTLNKINEVNLYKIHQYDDNFSAIFKEQTINILFLVVKNLSDYHFDQIKTIHNHYPALSILVISLQVTRDDVAKAIKCGAQGFISADAPLQEIREAVYSVRSGFDYFSSTITNLLVTNYVDVIRSDESSKIKNLEKLTKRELEILSLWGEGLQNTEIASKLFISVRTVETHKNHIMQKLGIRTSVDLLKFAIRNNLTSI